MRKRLALLLAALVLSGCSGQTEPVQTTEVVQPTEEMQLGNPWVSYETLTEAEAVVGFSLGLPETVAGSYQAESFRVMNGQVLEVIYHDDSFRVIVRKTPGEGQDISGVYTEYAVVKSYEFDGGITTVKYTPGNEDPSWLHLISVGGYSYSFYAPNGYWGDSNTDFLGPITHP